MEVNSSSNGPAPLSPEAPYASPKASAGTAGAHSAAANDINEVSSVDRTGQTSEFKHSGGEQYHSDGEPSLEPSPDDEHSTSDSLDVTG